MSVIVVLDQIEKSFGEEKVLSAISGKVHGIIGQNGSGKTVLFKCICGLIRPDSGKVLVNDKQIGRDTDFPESLGALIETPGFFPQMSGYKNLKLLASLRNQISSEDIKKNIITVGLDPESKKPVGKYSMGMRERLGIAQALMENPDLIILDEPFNGLDKESVKCVYKIIQGLKERKKTVFLASHNFMDIEILCDTVCEMDGGKLTIIKE